MRDINENHPARLSPSWPQAASAKTAFDAVRANPNSTEAQKRGAARSYFDAVRLCMAL